MTDHEADHSVVEVILTVLEEQLGVARPAPAANLMAEGLLDSLSLVELLAEVESELGVHLDLAMLELTDLESICTLSRFVERSL